MLTMIWKTIVLAFFSYTCFAQAGNVFTASFRIADVQQKEFTFLSQDDSLVLSLEERKFTDSQGSEFLLAKVGKEVFIIHNQDTLAVNRGDCIYVLTEPEKTSYHLKNHNLREKKRDVLDGKIKFKNRDVIVQVTQLDINLNQGIVYLYLYRLLIKAKVLNESNLFLTTILPGIF